MSRCVMDPNNPGLTCSDDKEKRCGTCGWNPAVAEKRRRQRLERIEAIGEKKEEDKDGSTKKR